VRTAANSDGRSEQREAKQLAHIMVARQRSIFTASRRRGGSSKLISLNTIKRIAVVVVGGTVLLLGIALLVLPGPAFIVIPLGLAILAAEFAWARRWLRKARNLLPKENDDLSIGAFVARHTRNFPDWAAVRRNRHVKHRKKEPKHETPKARASIVTSA
jgi:uncharacterized protein (TIGR02611 family)